METIEIIRQARVVQAERGHAKRYLQDAFGHVCIRGAINTVLNGNAQLWCTLSEDHEVLHALYEAMDEADQQLFHDPFYEPDTVVCWNNDDERTLEEVLALFDRAVMLLEARAETEVLVEQTAVTV